MSLRERLSQVFSPPTRQADETEGTGEVASQVSSAGGTSRGEASAATGTSGMTTRSRAARNDRPPRESEGFESAFESLDFQEVNVEDVDSDIDAGLSDGEPRRSPGEAPPDTDPEDNASEAEDIKESSPDHDRNTSSAPPVESLKEFTSQHCRAIIANPTKGAEPELVICGKFETECKQHRSKRRDNVRAKANWYLKVPSRSKHKDKTPVDHGDAMGYSCSTATLNKRLKRLQLDHVVLSDDEYPREDDTESEAGNQEGYESETEAIHQAQLLSIEAEIERLKREQRLLELEAKRAKLKAKSPKKRPTTTASRKKAPTPEKAPAARIVKQVQIDESSNTTKSLPPDPNLARKLEVNFATVQPNAADSDQALIQALARVANPFLEQMRATAETVRAAADQLRMSAQAPSRARQTGATTQQTKPAPSPTPAPAPAPTPRPAPVPGPTPTPGPTSAPGTAPAPRAATATPAPAPTPASAPTVASVQAPAPVPTPTTTPAPPAGMSGHLPGVPTTSASSLAWIEDESTGNKDKVFGYDITGLELDRVLSPEGMRARDMKGLYDSMDDIASLPGTCSPACGGGSGNESVEVMERWFQSMNASQAGTVITDTQWRNKKRNGLGTINTQGELTKGTQKTIEKEQTIFSNQRLLLHRYLRDRGYLPTFIDYYIQYGLLTRIIRDTYRYYVALLHAIREKRYERLRVKWEESEAYIILTYYADKMLDIRLHAADKKMLLLQNYIFLRDAYKKSFHTYKLANKLVSRAHDETERLREELETRLAKLESGGGGKGGGGKGGNGGEDKLNMCSHCRCRDLHICMKVEHNKAVCPLTDKPSKWAKAAAKLVSKAIKGDSKLSVEEPIKQVEENWDKQ